MYVYGNTFQERERKKKMIDRWCACCTDRVILQSPFPRTSFPRVIIDSVPVYLEKCLWATIIYGLPEKGLNITRKSDIGWDRVNCTRNLKEI